MNHIRWGEIYVTLGCVGDIFNLTLLSRSVETGLGSLNEQIPEAVEEEEEEEDADLELTVDDLENIDPTELEEFLKNF